MTDPYEREATIVWRIRVAIAVIALLAAAMVYVGYLDVQLGGQPRPAGGTPLLVYLVVLLAPGIAACWRPRWLQIVTWIMIAMPVTMLCGLLWIDRMGFPRWPYYAIAWLGGMLHVVLLFVLPLLRSMHKSPPLRQPLPTARIVT